ncbi:class I SAM-dependent methyltransferase [Desulfogranum japonicum]|uniref:class I SAM-dependent methyltransferase n=1 Tax=Desulfogranum japonicum TaxID=231447 RepID=UPI00040903DF|nr:class I SAM-dependent methyltransferase [Desulfogranum japonicum]
MNSSLITHLQDTTFFGRGQLIQFLEKEIVGNCQSLLDIGCGTHSPIEKFSQKIPVTVGIDLHRQSITEARGSCIHKKYLDMDARDIGNRFSNKSFDCVIAIELIEHLAKEEAVSLLDQMEKIAKKKVIISTPNGFVPQMSHSDNRHQEHLSGFDAQEMTTMGFRVQGFNGWKKLRGSGSRIKWSPKFFWFLVSRMTQLYTKSHPEYAYQIFCTKDVANS